MKAFLVSVLILIPGWMAGAQPAAPLPSSPAPQTDYLMFKGGPERHGYLPARLVAPITLAWSAKTDGAFYSSPAIYKDTVFAGNSDHHVYAYDLGSGKLKWKTELGERIYGSSPQIEGGRLYIACVDGCVYALDPLNGVE